MGNKRRAITVVLGALLFAFVSVAGAFVAFFGKTAGKVTDTVNTNAATALETKLTSSSVTITGLGNGNVYYVEFAGADGGRPSQEAGNLANGNKGPTATPGYGATCFAFYSSTGRDETWFVNANGRAARSDEGGAGGGVTIVNSNFAIPSGSSSGTATAAGGGGSGLNVNWSSTDHKWGGNGGNGGWATGGAGAKADGSKEPADGGGGATRSADGTDGNCYKDSKSGGGWAYGGSGGAGVKHGGDGGGGLYREGGHWYRTFGGGGGGSSSANCYPLFTADRSGYGNKSTGSGYILIYSLMGYTPPKGQTITYDGKTKAKVTNGTVASPGGSWGSTGARLCFEYSTNGVNGWTETLPEALNVNDSKTIYWRYVVYVSNLASGSGVIASDKIELKVNPAEGTINAPTLMANKIFDQKSERMVTAVGGNAANTTYKFAIVESANCGSNDYNCALDTSKHGKFTWLDKLDAAENNKVWSAGTYYIYYYATKSSDDNYKQTTVRRSSAVTISGRPPALSAGSLHPVDDTLYYTGRAQIMFDGKGGADVFADSDGTISYTVTRASNTTPSDSIMGVTSFDKLIEKTGDASATPTANAGTYYLWYRFKAINKNFGDQGWTAVKDKNGTHISKTINKAKLTSLNSDKLKIQGRPDNAGTSNYVVYDGASHAVFNGSATPGGAITVADLGAVTYQVAYTYSNGTKGTMNGNANTIFATEAGTYILTVSWGGSSNVEKGSWVLQPFVVQKLTETDMTARVKLDGYQMRVSETYNGPTGRLMVSHGELTIKIGNAAAVTLTNTLANAYNQVYFCVTQDPNNAPDASKFTTLATETNLKAARATVAGRNYIWLRFKQHMNLADGYRVCYPVYYEVAKATSDEINIWGLNPSPTKNFNAVSSQAFTGTLQTEKYFQLTGVEYSLGGPSASNGNWQTNLSQLTAINSGEYYLWIRWAETDSIAKCTGKVLDITPYQIFQKSTFDDLTFSGITKEAERHFDNLGHAYGVAEQGLFFSITGGGQNISAMTGTRVENTVVPGMGSISYAVSTNALSPVDDANSYKALNRATATNVGEYYLSVMWTGSQNIAPGKKLYSLDPFVIVKAGGNGDRSKEIQLAGISPKLDTARTYTGSPIALFKYDNTQPQLTVIGVEGGGRAYAHQKGLQGYKFAVTDNGSDYPALDSSEWKESLEKATQVDVLWDADHKNPEQPYYLWIMILADDNLNQTIVKIHDTTNMCTPILQANAFVLYPPTARSLEFTNEPQILIDASKQKDPVVQYGLRDATTNVMTWYDKAEQIKGTEAKTYTVYFRGLAGDNYKDEPESSWTDNTIMVTIHNTKGYVLQAPEDLNPEFNGIHQAIFKKGQGQYGEGQLVDLEYCICLSATDTSWNDNANWKDSPDDLKQLSAGTYVLYYRAKAIGGVDTGDKFYMEVHIRKAEINVTGKPGTYSGLIYKADEQKLLSGYATFELKNTPSIKHNSEILGKAEDIGLIEYGYSRDYNIEPAEWVDSYDKLKGFYAGDYYIWYRIWAGANHLGTGEFPFTKDKAGAAVPTAVCINASKANALVIKKADQTIVNFSVSGFKFFTGETARSFNGEYQALVDFDLTDEEIEQGKIGEVKQFINTNPTPTESKVWYALTSSKSSPSSGASDLWRDTINKATQRDVNPNGYYFHVKIEATANVEEIILCVNPDNPLYMNKATQSMLELSGITLQNKMYNGLYQALASGNLVVKIATTGAIIGGLAPQFCMLDKNDNNPLNFVDALSDATEMMCGDYFLWVKIPETVNICGTKPGEDIILSYNYFFDNSTPVKIEQADDTMLTVVGARLITGTKYEAKEQPLLEEGGAASVILKNGGTVWLSAGYQEYYFITTDADKIPLYSEDEDTDTVWVPSNALLGRDAGTYYIWVVFPEDKNIKTLGPVFCGSVTIDKATGDDFITKDNFWFKGITPSQENLFYNGLAKQLASGSLMQVINNVEIKPDDQTKYGYSTNQSVAPEVWYPTLAEITEINAGEYYIWVNVPESANIVAYIVSTQVAVVIAQAKSTQITFTGLSTILADDGGYIAYDATEHALWQGTLQLKIAGNDAEIPSDTYLEYVSWGISSGYNVEPTNWVGSLDDVTAVLAKEYYLWIRIVGNSNYQDFAVSLDDLVTQIKRGQAELITGSVEFFENLVYANRDQRLVKTPGNSNFDAFGGRVVFSLNDAVTKENPEGWITDYTQITGRQAGKYVVHYGVLDTENWIGFHYSQTISIDQAEAVFAVNPMARENLVYNDQEQVLIEKGKLHPDSDAAGCTIEYSLNPDMTDSGWDTSIEHIVQTDAGEYTVYYRTVAGEDPNYTSSKEPMSITVHIAQREIYWLQTPQAISGLKADGEYHELVTRGELSSKGIEDDAARRIKIKFTLNPETPVSDRTESIPTQINAGLYYVWYTVDYNEKNNVFVGAKEGMVVVIISTYIFSWHTAPSGVTLSYNGDEQTLVAGGVLQNINDVSENMRPQIVYTIEEQGPNGKTTTILKKGEVPSRQAVGEYKINYELVFNTKYPYAFYPSDGYKGEFISVIKKRSFQTNSLRAVINQRGEFDVEASEWDLPATLKSELSQKDSLTGKPFLYFEIRRYGATDWEEYAVPPADNAGYEIRVCIRGNESVNSYRQNGDYDVVKPNYTFKVQVNYEAGSIETDIRIWLGVTDSTSYDSTAIELKQQKNLQPGATVMFSFDNVSLTSTDGRFVILAQYVDNGRYYYLSPEPIHKGNRNNVLLDAINTSYLNILTLNKSLIDGGIINLYVYEVYRISYNANGGSTATLPENGWKWHGGASTPYQLADNTLTRANHTANGWSTTPGGTNHYNDGDYYKLDISQVFYAQFSGKADVMLTMRWIIEDYEIDNNGIWFNTANDTTRVPGMHVGQGERICLPNITNVNENGEITFSSELIYDGRYILKWVLQEDRSTEYQVGWTADRDLVFIAVLQKANSEYDVVEFSFYEEGRVNALVSNVVARGASSYMALSGVTASDFEKYDYDGWYQGYAKTLEPKVIGGSFVKEPLSHTFPALAGAELNNTEEDEQQQMMLMVIIIGAGAVVAIGACAIYLPIRRKRLQQNNK